MWHRPSLATRDRLSYRFHPPCRFRPGRTKAPTNAALDTTPFFGLRLFVVIDDDDP